MKKDQKASKRQQNIIMIVSAAIVILIIVAIIIGVNLSSNKKDSSDDKNPTATEAVTKSPEATKPADSPSETPKPDDVAKKPDTSTFIDPLAKFKVDSESSIKNPSTMKNAQKQFDDAIAAKKFDDAIKIVKEQFINSEYSETILAAYENIVTYYEVQDKYEESLNFQLNYIDFYDGIDNTTRETVHYTRMKNALSHVTSTDSRIEKIEASVARWDSIEALRKEKKYSEMEQQLLAYKNEGLFCPILYKYLGLVYDQQEKYLDEMKIYYEYMDKIDALGNPKQLEAEYSYLFDSYIAGLLGNDHITEEDVAPYQATPAPAAN